MFGTQMMSQTPTQEKEMHDLWYWWLNILYITITDVNIYLIFFSKLIENVHKIKFVLGHFDFHSMLTWHSLFNIYSLESTSEWLYFL